MRKARTFFASLVLLGAGLSGCTKVADQPPPDQVEARIDPGKELYKTHCAMCHDSGSAEAPKKVSIRLLGPESIMQALTTGVMKEQASALTMIEKRLVSEYLGAPTSESALANAKAHQCKGQLKLSSPVLWNRWGNNLHNTRFQPISRSGITPTEAPRLKLKWAFGFPGAARARSQPAVTKEAIFTGSQSGLFYALDSQSGCVWWTFAANAEVRNAPTISVGSDGEPKTLYFGDFDANVYAVDAATGKLLWSRSIKDHPAGTITGSLTLYKGRLYIPMSSTEVINAYNTDYECCTFRGGIVALNSKSGETIWRFHTVPEPKRTSKNSKGADRYGPSGAPVWSSPTVDAKRGLLYFGTGENYSSPATDKSDSIIALRLDTGAVEWVQQTIAGDAWNAACGKNGTQVNCPEEDGPDFDFGAPPIVITLANGKDIILAGQKSGMVYGMDPDQKGRIVWQIRAGMGGFNGGVHWGMASDGKRLIVGIADTPGNRFAEGPSRQGLHAFDPATGQALWSQLEPNVCSEDAHKCRTALSAPPTITPGLVFAGALNGLLRVYSSEDGKPVWSTDTRRDYQTINGVKARGGSIDSGGPVVAGGLLIVNSGYDKFGQIPGNVLLVYGVE
jgi:polyvinyl alcohol dehydrogenase (cytochrome)